MAPKKKVTGFIKLQIQAGAATPAPPVGPALGQHGVNIMEFVKAYNDATASQKGQIIPVEITVYEDRSFTFITKTPPASRLILKAAGVEKGSAVPHKTKVANITMTQVKEIATLKMSDLNANDIDAASKIIAGTARSMGITVNGQHTKISLHQIGEEMWENLAGSLTTTTSSRRLKSFLGEIRGRNEALKEILSGS